MAKIYGQLERAQAENLSSPPAAGLPGRQIWDTTAGALKVDNGTEFITIGGGGAGGLIWEEVGPAPLSSYGLATLYRTYEYEPGSDIQNLYASTVVPSTYTSGQINLLAYFVAAGSSNTVLFRTETTLHRGSTDDLQTNTNQHTSTNSAVTLTAGTNTTAIQITLDLCDSSSQINGVTVSAGDIINIRLYRETDTFTGTAYFLPRQSTEVQF